MSKYETLIVEKKEKWAEITINRPDVLNAINDNVVADLHSALDQLKGDKDIMGLIILGAGDKAFVAGADVEALLKRGREDALKGINSKLFQKIEDFPWPVIAAIKGYALGGGCELTLACDIRIGGKGTQMGQPEGRLGIIAAAGGTHRLPRIVGTGIAREMLFTGKIIDSEEAYRIGLLNHIVEDNEVVAKAREIMVQVSKMAPQALRLAKKALNKAGSTAHDHSKVENEYQAILFESEDKKQRMTKFLERRNKK